MRGFPAKARAISRRCVWPPERPEAHAHRHLFDIFGKAGKTGGLPGILDGAAGDAKDVFADRTGHEPARLQHHADLPAQGCGKSTLLRLLLGFERPQRVGIFYDVQNLKDLDLRALVDRGKEDNEAGQYDVVLQHHAGVEGDAGKAQQGRCKLGREQRCHAVGRTHPAGDLGCITLRKEIDRQA